MSPRQIAKAVEDAMQEAWKYLDGCKEDGYNPFQDVVESLRRDIPDIPRDEHGAPRKPAEMSPEVWAPLLRTWILAGILRDVVNRIQSTELLLGDNPKDELLLWATVLSMLVNRRDFVWDEVSSFVSNKLDAISRSVYVLRYGHRM